MARISKKKGAMLTAAAMALAVTSFAPASYAQREDRGAARAERPQRGGGFGERRSAPQQRAQPAQRPQRAQQQPRPIFQAPRENARVDMGTQLRQAREREQRQAQRPTEGRGDWQRARPDGDRGQRVDRRDDNRDRAPSWRADNDRRVDGDRTRNPAWRADNDRRDNDRWRDNDRRDNDRWRNNDRRDNDRWRDNDRRQQAWNRNDWRRDNRYDWQRYRDRNRAIYRPGRYYAPYSNYSYRRVSIGFSLGSMFYGNRYWINDPWQYRLPPVYGPYRWIRYYDDVMLVDIYSGEVVDVIYDFFW